MLVYFCVGVMVLSIVSHHSQPPVHSLFSELIMFLIYFYNSIIAAEAAGTVVEGAAGGTALLGVVLILLGELFYFCLFSLFCVLLFASRCMLTISTERQCHSAEQFSLLFCSVYFALHLTLFPLSSLFTHRCFGAESAVCI